VKLSRDCIQKEGWNLLITREIDYALRILRALSEGEQVSAAQLCQRELIPQPFAYKIMRKLSKAGFVLITRGADGGCRLVVDLKEKTLYDLLSAMDSVEFVNACMALGYQCPWRERYGGKCGIHMKLESIQQAIDRELQSHSLASILSSGLD
jgi:Rrf2 family protein